MVYLVTKTKKAMVSLETIAHILPPLENSLNQRFNLKETWLLHPPTEASKPAF
jgi:hypothetical protein